MVNEINQLTVRQLYENTKRKKNETKTALYTINTHHHQNINSRKGIITTLNVSIVFNV